MAEVDGWAYVIAAYTVTWIMLGGYAWYLHRRSRRAAERYQRVDESARAEFAAAESLRGGSGEGIDESAEAGSDAGASGAAGRQAANTGSTDSVRVAAGGTAGEPSTGEDSEALS